MKKFHLKNRSKLFLILTAFIILGSLLHWFGYPTKLFTILPSINSINTCKPKTVCTRKTDGRKDCTTYQCPTIENGVKTTKTSSEIISDTGGLKKVVEYKYDVVKTVPVDHAGTPTGNSTTTETRKKIKGSEEEEEILSTVTTIQKPPTLDEKGLPTGAGEVVSDVRTGDISLGVNSLGNDYFYQYSGRSCRPEVKSGEVLGRSS